MELNDSLRYELKKNPFFAAYTDKELVELFALARPTVFPARTEIFAQGDPGDCMYILLEGKVKISRYSSTGKETVLSFLGAGEVLGEIALLDEGVRTASVFVLEETRALKLLRKDVLPFIENNSRIAMQIISVLCARLRQTDVFVEEITTLQAGPRLAKALLRLSDMHGKEEDGQVVIKLKLSQANLGAHAGLMRENVNRQLKAWEDEGVIASANGIITLLDVPKLEKVISEASAS